MRPDDDATAPQQFKAALQKLLPTRALSAFMFGVASISYRPFRRALIGWFARSYGVDMSEAERPALDDYGSFNEFFTRGIRPRPLPADPRRLACPVDGYVSRVDFIREGSIIQAKGREYTVADLLADEDVAAEFWNGSYCNLYLAPHNYHRVHMPCAGRLRHWSYVPGRLLSVSPATARAVPNLFSTNERVVAVFDTEFGPMAYVMVGALLVGGIETVWHGRVTPPHRRKPLARYYEPTTTVKLERGAEVGRFMMGSTVILLAPAGAVAWNDGLQPDRPVRMGTDIGSILRPATD